MDGVGGNHGRICAIPAASQWKRVSFSSPFPVRFFTCPALAAAALAAAARPFGFLLYSQIGRRRYAKSLAKASSAVQQRTACIKTSSGRVRAKRQRWSHFAFEPGSFCLKPSSPSTVAAPTDATARLTFCSSELNGRRQEKNIMANCLDCRAPMTAEAESPMERPAIVERDPAIP
ncbi:hypothetical protein CDD82_4772 [Ophiocordyceps australis]|uniref:Uncharacterized protein n=1 Tax=Ophiocordyceps australis TaxID=1399860 RepID=A0A2C5ZSK6_9HYPO|nr:hypothetical protein CDD82_4772 [Ophiocordyceps australis]